MTRTFFSPLIRTRANVVRWYIGGTLVFYQSRSPGPWPSGTLDYPLRHDFQGGHEDSSIVLGRISLIQMA